MKVLLIIPGGIGSGIDGLGIPVINNFVEGISNLTELTVLSIYKISPDFVSSEFRIHTLDLEHGVSPISKVISYIRYLRIHRNEQYDIIHSIWTLPHGLYALIAARLFKAKTVTSLQGGCQANISSIKYGGNQSIFRKVINSITLQLTDAITSETKFQKALLSPSLQSKVSIHYYGVKKNMIAKTALFKNKPIISTLVKFIHVANLTPVKDQKTLLLAFSLILQKYNAELEIIGPDHFSGEIQRYANQLEIQSNVEFSGYLPNRITVDRIRSADIMLHTSVFESTCMSVIEAWSQGTLVCGTKVGIMSDFENELCLCSEVGDSQHIANNAIQVIENNFLASTLRANAMEWCKQNTMQHYVNTIDRIYNSL